MCFDCPLASLSGCTAFAEYCTDQIPNGILCGVRELGRSLVLWRSRLRQSDERRHEDRRGGEQASSLCRNMRRQNVPEVASPTAQ